MRRRTIWMFLAAALPVLLLGCATGADVSKGRLVNETDPSQILELTADVAQTTNILIRIGIKTGASKFFGKTVGVYALKTPGGTTTGKFVAFKPLRSTVQGIHFNPDNGTEWSLLVQPDGSFRDAAGSIWRLRS